MSDSGLMESDDLLRLALAQSQAAEFDDDDDEDFDDDDEMWEFDDDDEEDFDDDDEMLEFDDDDDEMIAFDDESAFVDDEMAERRGRRRRRRRSFRRPRFRRFGRRRSMRRVKGSRSTTLRGRNGQRMRVRFGKSFATSAEVNKLIASTNKRFATAVKERKANHDALSKRIASATKDLDGKVASLRRSVKSLEKRSQTSSMLSLLQGAPKAEKIKLTGTNAGALQGEEIEAEITFKKQDIMLPLLLGGGLGGKSGGMDDTLVMALILSNSNK